MDFEMQPRERRTWGMMEYIGVFILLGNAGFCIFCIISHAVFPVILHTALILMMLTGFDRYCPIGCNIWRIENAFRYWQAYKKDFIVFRK